MSSQKITCPVCGQSDQVAKVSTIYLEGIGLNRLPDVKKSSNHSMTSSSSTLTGLHITPRNLYLISRQLAPPAGKSAAIRPVHPDIIIVGFSIVIPFFLAGIFSAQTKFIIPAVFVLLGFYSLYFSQRSRMIARYEEKQAEIKFAAKRIENGIQTWMKLYYCRRDDGVFMPGKMELVQTEEMQSYLLR